MARRISASFVLPISSQPLRYGVITLDNQSVLTDLISMGDSPKESSRLEYFNGVLCPGFINLSNTQIDRQINPTSKIRLIYENGIRALITLPGNDRNESEASVMRVDYINSGNETDCSFTLDCYEFKDVEHFERKAKDLSGNSRCIVWVENLNLLPVEFLKQPSFWFILSEITLRSNEKKQLIKFFRENAENIIFSWNAYDTRELFSLFNYFLDPDYGFSMQEVLRSITLNPSRLISEDGIIGEFKVGAIPGINLITGIDFAKMIFKREGYSIKRLA